WRFRITYAVDTEFERGAFDEVDVSVSKPGLHRDGGRPTGVLHRAEETQAADDDSGELRTEDGATSAACRVAIRRHASLPLPVFVHLRSSHLGPSLLPLIVRLTAPLPDRLEQTCRLFWAQVLLRCRRLSGRWRVILRGVLPLLPLLAL